MAFNPINGSMLKQKERAKAPHPALVAGALAKHLAKMVGAESPTVRVTRRAPLCQASRHTGDSRVWGFAFAWAADASAVENGVALQGSHGGVLWMMRLGFGVQRLAGRETH